MATFPAKVLGKSLFEFREHFGLTDHGERTAVDDDTEVWAFKDSGVAVKMTKGRASAVFLYSDGHAGFTKFTGELDGLRTDSSKQVVRYKLGYPSKHREGQKSTVLDTFPNYDRYDYADYSLHIQYDEPGTRSCMLTIMSPDEVRRIDTRPEVSNRPVVYDKAKYHQESVQEQGLPDEQSAVHTAFFLGWLMDNDLCSVEFIDDSREEIAAYKRREKTALEIYGRWDYCLVDDMLSDEGNAFAKSYFDFSTGKYIDDFVELLARKLPSEFHVSYTWKNQQKINHRVSKRYADWKVADPQANAGPARNGRERESRQPRRAKGRPPRQSPTKESKAEARRAPRPKDSGASPRSTPVHRAAAGKRRSRIFSWVVKFILFPVLAVATGLAIITYTMTL